jgi:hypothetical protein
VTKFLELMKQLGEATDRWNETHDAEGGDAGYGALIEQLLGEVRMELLDDDEPPAVNEYGEDELAKAPRREDARSRAGC